MKALELMQFSRTSCIRSNPSVFRGAELAKHGGHASHRAETRTGDFFCPPTSKQSAGCSGTAVEHQPSNQEFAGSSPNSYALVQIPSLVFTQSQIQAFQSWQRYIMQVVALSKRSHEGPNQGSISQTRRFSSKCRPVKNSGHLKNSWISYLSVFHLEEVEKNFEAENFSPN